MNSKLGACLLFVAMGLQIPGTAQAEGFNVDIGYWRITSAKTRFEEKVLEGDAREGSGPGLDLAGIGVSRTVLEIETDPSKFIFDANYRFVDSLHRLTVGVAYAGVGNDKVKEVGVLKQVRDVLGMIRDFNFNARSLAYTNVYAKYRLLPLPGDFADDEAFLHRGIDVYLTWTSIDQKFSIAGNDFSMDADSFGIGIGGERRIADRFSLWGRMVYLPFFEIEGSGWDNELKLFYAWSDAIHLYFGGKWLSIDAETEQSIRFAGVPGFSDSPVVFRNYDADLAGFTVGGSIRF